MDVLQVLRDNLQNPNPGVDKREQCHPSRKRDNIFCLFPILIKQIKASSLNPTNDYLQNQNQKTLIMFGLKSGIQRSMAPAARRLASASATPKNKLVPVSTPSSTLLYLQSI